MLYDLFHVVFPEFMCGSPPGLLQFSKGPPPDPAGEMIRPALAAASITVEEEVGEIRLLVVRAQGLLGRVLVGYRTVPLTAVSPYDYEVTALPSIPFLPSLK